MSRKIILGASVVLLGVFFLLFSGIILIPSQNGPPLIDLKNTATRMQILQHDKDSTSTRQADTRTEKQGDKQKDTQSDGKAELPRRDIVDNSGAIKFLKHYASLFNRGFLSPLVLPNMPSSIVTWWQAAAMIDWYINTPIRQKCAAIRPMGNWHICQDKPFTIKPPCLVYSFGINFDFSFDDDMGKLGCEVHSFDPSMNTTDHKRNKNVTFHNMGLSNFNADAFDPPQDNYVKDAQTWKMRTLKSVVTMLGHENRVIDVLKIDIEGHEWAVVENMFETGMFPFIRQFMTEWHLFPLFPVKKEYVHLYQVYTALREMGFREYRKGPHPKTMIPEKFNNQGDSEYVNIFFKKRSGWT